MKRLLITGFEPFGGEAINPSWEVVKSLPCVIGDYELTKLLLPVVFGLAAEKALEASEEICPDVIVCIGQAGGRGEVTPELVGINLRHASITDNAGNKPQDEPIIEGGQAAYFSTIPVRKISEAISAEGVPSKVSYSAGAYVCNDLLYTLLNRYDGTSTRVGFIHIPYATEQEKTPSMSLSDMKKAIIKAVEAID